MNTKKRVQASHTEKERLRRSYRPASVKVLFVGEAPPASGRFFYQADSGLYRAFRATFAVAFPSLRDDDFLKSFRALGCYLIDLCASPVDRLNRAQRGKVCFDSESRLSRVLKQLRPPIVVIVVRSIAPNVRRSIEMAGWKGQLVELPYPGRWLHHQAIFKKQLLPVLRKLRQ